MVAPNDRESWRLDDVVDGRYRLEERVGRGGFGTVFRATQIDNGREVALKLLAPELCDTPEAVKRFEREGRLVQGLTHPNTVRLFDFGRARGTMPYLVLEYLRGESLLARVRREHGLPSERVRRIASQVLKSLMEAHAAGVVHRDVKPANILLCEHAGFPDFVKLLDFGVAKTAPTKSQTALTQEGQAVGTAHYMAPEQVSGRGVVAATDLYALGLVMAEALTGERVFGAGTALEICMRQVSPEPVPLTASVLADPLGAVIARATEKTLERRFVSAAEMLAAIEPATARGPSADAPTTHAAVAVTRAAPIPAGQYPAWVPQVPPPYPPAPGVHPSTAPAKRGSGSGRVAAIVAGALVVGGGAVGGAVWLAGALGDASGSAAPASSGAGAPSANSALADAAGTRRAAWVAAALTGRDNEMAAIRKVTIGADQVVIKNQFAMTCGLRFGDDGRPAELFARSGVSACVGPEGWRSKEPKIALVCTEGGGRETCRGKYTLMSPQGFGDAATLELIRPLDGATGPASR